MSDNHFLTPKKQTLDDEDAINLLGSCLLDSINASPRQPGDSSTSTTSSPVSFSKASPPSSSYSPSTTSSPNPPQTTSSPQQFSKAPPQLQNYPQTAHFPDFSHFPSSYSNFPQTDYIHGYSSPLPKAPQYIGLSEQFPISFEANNTAQMAAPFYNSPEEPSGRVVTLPGEAPKKSDSKPREKSAQSDSKPPPKPAKTAKNKKAPKADKNSNGAEIAAKTEKKTAKRAPEEVAKPLPKVQPKAERSPKASEAEARRYPKKEKAAFVRRKHSPRRSAPPKKENFAAKAKKEAKIFLSNGFSNLAVDSDESYEDSDHGEQKTNRKDVKDAKSNKRQNGGKSPRNNAKSKAKTLNAKAAESEPPRSPAVADAKSLWNLGPSAEKQNIRKFWQSLTDAQREEMVNVPKCHIVGLLETHFKISCICGSCQRSDRYIYGKLSQLYDRFYKELMQVGIDEELQTDFGVYCLNDDDMTLQVRIKSDHIDEELVKKSSLCVSSKFNHYLCERVKRKCEKRQKSPRKSEVARSEESSGSEEGKAAAAPQPRATPAASFSAHKDFLEICENEEKMALMNNVYEEIHRQSHAEADGARRITPQSLRDSYANAKKEIFQLIERFVPQGATSFEEMSLRLDVLMQHLHQAYEMQTRMRMRHDLEQQRLEGTQKGDAAEMEKKHPAKENRFQHLSLRQEQLGEMRQQLDEHFAEQKALQQQIFAQLQKIFHQVVFDAPLAELRPELKLAIIGEFKAFASIDESLYDDLMAEEYPAVAAKGLLGKPDEFSSDEGFDDDCDEEYDEYDEEVHSKEYEECCKMFKCFAVKLFHQRVLRCYLELVSEQKQRALLAEEDQERLRRQRKKEKRKNKRRKARQKTRQKGAG